MGERMHVGDRGEGLLEIGCGLRHDLGVVRHARELHVKYLIFDNRSWRAYNPSAGWRAYRYPGPNPNNPTTKHENHVHMSVYP